MSAPKVVRNSLGQFAPVRTPPPPLEFRSPDCPTCGKEVDHDGDGFRCYDCGASWYGDPLAAGEWDDPTEPACPSEIEYHNTAALEPKYESIRHARDRCFLADDGHTKHRAPDAWLTWTDDDPRVVRKAGAR